MICRSIRISNCLFDIKKKLRKDLSTYIPTKYYAEDLSFPELTSTRISILYFAVKSWFSSFAAVSSREQARHGNELIWLAPSKSCGGVYIDISSRVVGFLVKNGY